MREHVHRLFILIFPPHTSVCVCVCVCVCVSVCVLYRVSRMSDDDNNVEASQSHTYNSMRNYCHFVLNFYGCQVYSPLPTTLHFSLSLCVRPPRFSSFPHSTACTRHSSNWVSVGSLTQKRIAQQAMEPLESEKGAVAKKRESCVGEKRPAEYSHTVQTSKR
jgi:hypothetical protein